MATVTRIPEIDISRVKSVEDLERLRLGGPLPCPICRGTRLHYANCPERGMEVYTLDGWLHRPQEEMVTLPRRLLMVLIHSAKENTGAEPSLSLFERTVDEVLEYVKPLNTP